MNLCTESQARQILEPHLGVIKRIMNESLGDIGKSMGVISVPVNKRAKCTLLHSIAVAKAEKYLSETSGIKLKKKYQSLQIIFDNTLVGRIKKVDNNHMARNARSDRNDYILSQQPTLFDGLDLPPDNLCRTTFIDLGYKIDSIWANFERLIVVCRLNDSILWYIDFTDTNESIVPIIVNPNKNVSLNNEDAVIKLREAK